MAMAFSSLPKTVFGEAPKQAVHRDQDKNVYGGVEYAHGGSQAVFAVQEGVTVHIGGDNVAGFVNGGVVQQQDFFIAHAHHAADAHDELNRNHGDQPRQGYMQNPLNFVGPVDVGRLVELGVDGGERGQIDDGIPAHLLPHGRKNVNRAVIFRFTEQVYRGVVPIKERNDGVDDAGGSAEIAQQTADNHNHFHFCL